MLNKSLRWLLPVVLVVATLLVAFAWLPRQVPQAFPTFEPDAPWQEPERPSPPDPDTPPPALLAVGVASEALPDRMSGHPRSGSDDSVVAGCVVPLATRTTSWSRPGTAATPSGPGDWTNPVGTTVVISAYPAGMGGMAAGCATGKVVRRGDLVAEVFTRGTTADLGPVRDALDKATSGVCTNPSADGDESYRNPASGSRFTGLLVDEPVASSLQVPTDVMPATSPRQVDIPRQPSHPHAPQSLPPAPPEPPSLQELSPPDLATVVRVRAEDTAGPGCGWAWSATVPPAFDKAAVAASNEELVSSARSELDARAREYMAARGLRSEALERFEALNPAWEQWVDRVEEISSRWDQQSEQWEDYERAVRRHDDAVRDRDEFLRRQSAARSEFDAATAACMADPVVTPPVVTQTMTPPPVVTTTTPDPSLPPVATSSQPPEVVTTTQPPATGTPCPTRPAILDQQPPGVPELPREPRFS